MQLNFNVNLPDLANGREITQDKANNILFKSMDKIRLLARQKAPTDTGQLKRSIQIRPRQPGESQYQVLATVNYAAFVEFGTDPHTIKPNEANALAFEWTDVGGQMLSKSARRRKQGTGHIKPDTAVFKKVEHPGTPEQPFFRPALKEVQNIHLYDIAETEFRQ